MGVSMGVTSHVPAFSNSPRQRLQVIAYVSSSNFQVLPLWAALFSIGVKRRQLMALWRHLFIRCSRQLISVKRHRTSITKIELEKHFFWLLRGNKYMYTYIYRHCPFYSLPSWILRYHLCDSCVPTARHALLGFLSSWPTRRSGRPKVDLKRSWGRVK